MRKVPVYELEPTAVYYRSSGVRVHEGAAIDDHGAIVLGEEGRGRQLVRVPLPEGAEILCGRVMRVPVSGENEVAVVLIRDMSGFRGTWRLTAPASDAYYEAIARGEAPARPERGEPPVREIARGYCAQGEAGRMGGGPEILAVFRAGAVVEIVRQGRLYGAPAVVRVTANPDGSIEVSDPLVAARERLAAAAW